MKKLHNEEVSTEWLIEQNENGLNVSEIVKKLEEQGIKFSKQSVHNRYRVANYEVITHPRRRVIKKDHRIPFTADMDAVFELAKKETFRQIAARYKVSMATFNRALRKFRNEKKARQ